MIHKNLAKTNVTIPAIGLGTWSYQAGPGPLRLGLEAGALFIDTAESYGSETVVGEAIRGIRDRVFVATKVSPHNFRAADFVNAAEKSLLNLGVDHVDLLQLHQPNPEIPIAETLGAMGKLIQQGKVRFAGVSNFSVAQLREASQVLGDSFPIVSNQVRYSLIDRTIESELLPYCAAHEITVIAYSPLGRVFSRIGDCDPHGVIGAIAKHHGKSESQVVLNWCVSRPNVVAIPKGNSASHILDNCDSASGWALSPADIARLDSEIQFRRRGRMDEMLRRYMPRALRGAAVHAMNLLPKSIRRRVS